MKELFSTVAITSILATASVGPPSNEPVELDVVNDSDSIIQDIAPNEFLETNTYADFVDVAETSAAISITAGSPTPEDPQNFQEITEWSDELPENLDYHSEISSMATTSVYFEVTYVDSIDSESDSGLSILTSEADSSYAAYVQPTHDGVRVLTSIADATSPASYSYDFNVPETAILTSDEDSVYIEDDNTVYAVLDHPWARDASGAELPTSFTWDSGTLTQHIDFEATDSFPVLADPAWRYSYTFNYGKTPVRASSLLRSCFNCYFPVSGAPRGYPRHGQLLPLRVAGLNFECRMGSTTTPTRTRSFIYRFTATGNHIDEAGSTISFSFRHNHNLVVSARVKNRWMNNQGYRAGAYRSWDRFALNLRRA